MEAERFLDGRVNLYTGDCLEVLAGIEENSVDSCVTDPPYHLTSIVKRFGAPNAAPVKTYESMPYGGGFQASGGGTGAAFARMSKGFMGKQWDGGDIAFQPEVWVQVFRVLKPGGYLLAFGGTRTYHRMACAIEDAGFEVRDMVSWLYGSGFPKSHDVSKGIDRAAGAEREVVGNTSEFSGRTIALGTSAGFHGDIVSGHCRDITAPATDAAREWQGWGTALKPALEPICMARKPLSEGTVAANVLAHGTGAINIDGCRVESGAEHVREGVIRRNAPALADPRNDGRDSGGWSQDAAFVATNHPGGRWPANVIHDGSEEVTAAFPETTSGTLTAEHRRKGGYSNDRENEIFGKGSERGCAQDATTYGASSGSAARFFYSSKADADDRLGSKHPTIKPVDLMQYLVRLVTPKGGTVLDPFSGTGTTGEAAWREGMCAILIERETEYQDDIRRRMALAMSGPDERARESIKQRIKNKPRDDGPLFGCYPPIGGES